jgi:hypothetical protein
VDGLATYLAVRDIEARRPACERFCSLTSHRCEAEPLAGAPCRASANCASDQACSNGRCERRGPGEVALRSPSGESCTLDQDCAAGGCVSAPNGTRVCGKKCGFDLAALTAHAPLRPLALPNGPAAARR